LKFSACVSFEKIMPLLLRPARAYGKNRGSPPRITKALDLNFHWR
jgi:hypothetical protein